VAGRGPAARESAALGRFRPWTCGETFRGTRTILPRRFRPSLSGGLSKRGRAGTIKDEPAVPQAGPARPVRPGGPRRAGASERTRGGSDGWSAIGDLVRLPTSSSETSSRVAAGGVERASRPYGRSARTRRQGGDGRRPGSRVPNNLTNLAAGQADTWWPNCNAAG